MPTVWIRSTDRPRFHRHPDCRLLVKRPPRGPGNPIREVELAELNFATLHARPCKVCYPDAPRAKVARRFCPECNKSTTMPCAHNGGVRVTLAARTTYVSLLRDPGDEYQTQAYVWPDQAWFYQPLAS